MPATSVMKGRSVLRWPLLLLLAVSLSSWGLPFRACVEPPLPLQPGFREAQPATKKVGVPLEEASYTDLAEAITMRLAKDEEQSEQRLTEVYEAKRELDDKQRALEETRRRIFQMTHTDDVVELNVGGQLMSTTRAVLCSVEGSLLAGLFSGNFDNGNKKDKENRTFLDVDPLLFTKILSHLRLRQFDSPGSPAPLPQVPEDLREEWNMLVKYFGLKQFIYGEERVNIFEKLADLVGCDQSKLQTSQVIQLTLNSTAGNATSGHEEILGAQGIHREASEESGKASEGSGERSEAPKAAAKASKAAAENRSSTHPSTIAIKFLQHKVRVQALELRAFVADLNSSISKTWMLQHGNDTVTMDYKFTKATPCTGLLELESLRPSFTNEIVLAFPGDFCLEHIALYGQVVAN